MSILVGAIILGAGFVNGLTGFGFGIVAIAALPLVMDIKVANPLVSTMAVVTMTGMLIPIRRHIDFKVLPRAFAGTAIGLPLGVYALVGLPSNVLSLALAVFIILYVGEQLFFQRISKLRLSPNWGYLAGGLSGVLAGAINSGGPAMVVYLNSQDWDKTRFKATLLLYFVGLTTVKLVLLFFAGLLTVEVLRSAALYVGFAALGIFAGVQVFNRVHERWFRAAVLILLLAMAVVLIVRSVRAG